MAQVKSLELFPPRLFAHILVADTSSGNLTPNSPAEVVISAADKLSDVRKALLHAVLPDAVGQEFRIWELPGPPVNTRYIPLKDLAVQRPPKELEDSEETVADSSIEDLDSFAVEIRYNGEWVVRDPTTVEASSSQQTQAADDTPKPLFQSGSDFFSQMQSKSSAVTQITKPTPSRDPRPAPKVCSILPGTLGLGNMWVCA